MIDKKTSYLSLPLPHAENALAEDCPRLTEALTTLDGHAQSADARLDGVEASAVHTTGDETVSGTKTFTQTIAGTAAAAEKLATARTITLTGDATGSVSFDGSADTELAVTVGSNVGGIVGEIRWFAMPTPPEGWLACNGAEVLISDYPALYNAIGKLFLPKDVPDPPGMFFLPNLMGKVPWGSSSQVGTEMEAGLPNIIGYISAQMPGGTPPWANGGDGALSNNYVEKNYSPYTASTGTVLRSSSDKLEFDASRSNPIYGRSDTVQPPALCLLPCIRYE